MKQVIDKYTEETGDEMPYCDRLASAASEEYVEWMEQKLAKLFAIPVVSESLPSFEDAEDEAENNTDGIEASIYYLEGFNVGFLKGYDWIMSKVNAR